MNLKTIPEDFKVTEIPIDRQITDSGDFKIYQLKKKNVETFFLLSKVSKLNKIPVGKIGYAGLKDKYAFTSQYISIPSKYSINTKIDYITDKENSAYASFKLLGHTDSEIKRGDLEGNHFLITVRDITQKEIERIADKALNIQMGVPNYYDSQRFGSAAGKDFIGKYVIKKDFEKAIKIYLTSFTNYDSEELSELKERIYSEWSSLKNIKTDNKEYQIIIDEYVKTNDWQKAYLKIPQNLREMFIFSYQSYLWNRAVEDILYIYLNPRSLFQVRYKVGQLTFYKGLSEQTYNKMPKQLQTISNEELNNEFEKKVYNKILSSEGISIKDFDIKSSTKTFLKSSNRNILLFPGEFKVKKAMKDDLNKGKMKAIFSFYLEKGSYATIIVKKLLSK